MWVIRETVLSRAENGNAEPKPEPSLRALLNRVKVGRCSPLDSPLMVSTDDVGVGGALLAIPQGWPYLTAGIQMEVCETRPAPTPSAHLIFAPV